MGDYSDKLRDPRWQKIRLEVMERDGWRCKACGHDERTLNVHHLHYRRGADPWECGRGNLLTLCEQCHADTHEEGGSLVDLEQFMHSFLDRSMPLDWLMSMAVSLDLELPRGLQLSEDEWHWLHRHFVRGLRQIAAGHGFDSKQPVYRRGQTSFES